MATIGVIGLGAVGEAIRLFYKGDVKIYDRYKPEYSKIGVLDKCKYIFVCVPTPYRNGFDKSEMDNVFEDLSNFTNKIIIIKSTVLPGTTWGYQEKYPQHKILFNPEFLTEKWAMHDFANPDRQIVGYTIVSECVAEEVLNLLPKAPYCKTMPSEEAELVKYMFNTYYATKVVFANQIYDLCDKLGFDYDTIREAFLTEKKNANNHFDIWHNGYRGFAGKCLPKDLNALIDFGVANSVDLSLLKEVKKINDKLTDRQE